jgi:hypothetical protein
MAGNADVSVFSRPDCTGNMSYSAVKGEIIRSFENWHLKMNFGDAQNS